MAIKALVFDFDGLILDTETTEFQAWQELYQEHGCELPLGLWADCIGRPHGFFDPYAHLAELSGKSLEREALRARRKARHRQLLELETTRPGVHEYLAEAQRLRLQVAVASSSTHEWVGGHLERLGLRPSFHWLTCAEDTTRHKPYPEPYLAAVAALGVKPEEAIALEDSPNGIAAAKAAGLFCVSVPNSVTGRLDLSAADLRVDSLAAMPLAKVIALAEKRGPSRAR